MLRVANECLLLSALLALTAGTAISQNAPNPVGEAWRKRTLEAYANAKPTPDLAKMSTLEKLVAIEEIRQLPLKYTRYINQRDWDRWVNLFTDESDYWQYTIGKIVTGPKGWRQHLDAVGMTSEKMHSLFENLGDSEIEILSPTTARGVWQEMFIFWSPPGETPTKGFLVGPGQQSRTYAIYYQTYKKVNGTWKIDTNLPSTIRTERGPLPEGVMSPKLEIPTVTAK
jgi:SnoaL-like domain